MSCPFFQPVNPITLGSGPVEAMLPLGDFWDGVCCAIQQSRQPSDSVLKRLCNMGYARGECSFFPETDGPDAVRFALHAASEDSIQVLYVFERAHYPYANGKLTYSIANATVSGSPAGEMLQGQARAYARSFLRRTEGRRDAT